MFDYSEESILQRVLYRDALILILNKPGGIPVHKGSGKTQSLDTTFHHLRFGLPRNPELAHRLDKDTSGCLVLGRNAHALKILGLLFQQNKIKKTYLAVVHGHPQNTKGIIDLPLLKQSDKHYHWWMKVDPQGQQATTEYEVISQQDNFSLLKLKPLTGRTHQLRVHCAAIQCPIVGDKIYGQKDDPYSTMMLHALQITIPLYQKKESVQVVAPPPEEFLLKG